MKRQIALFLSALGLILASSAAPAAQASISGEVSYPERIPIPPGAHLVVKILDVSRHDSRATVSAETGIPDPRRLPLAFTLRFDGNLIIPAHRYGLDVAITADGATWFHTPEPVRIDPLDPLNSTQVSLRFVGTITNLPGTEGSTSNGRPGIVGVHWRVTAINGTPVPAEPELSLMITDDLQAGGRGGCNSYMAQAVLEGEKLAFSPVASTHVVCPAAIMADEKAFYDALGRVVTYIENGADLTLFDVDGRAVLTLSRSGD